MATSPRSVACILFTIAIVACQFRPNGLAPAATCSTDADCDDEIACTAESCNQGFCTAHVPDDALCQNGEVCQVTTGCEMAVQCEDDVECEDNDPCTLDVCDEAGICRLTPDPRCDEFPETTITAAPAAQTNSDMAAFTFTANLEATFKCSLDDAAFEDCESPKSYTGLTGGNHTFKVQATDLDGDVEAEPATYVWNVDLGRPETTITGAPALQSDTAAATFAFEANEPATFECSLDGASFAACTSPVMLSGLANGDHTFEVRAIDAVGNTEIAPASHDWNVEPVTCTITCKGTITTNGTNYRYVEVTGLMRPSYVNRANCVPPAGAQVRHGWDGPGGSWPQYDASGNYVTGGGPLPAPYTTDTPNTGSPYIVRVELAATQMNVVVDGCGYLDLNASTDSVGGRCTVANDPGNTCHLNPAGTAVLMQ